MRLNHVELVVAIAQAGSLQGAAEILGRSQPAVSKGLQQAEAELGTKIFLRTSRGVHPTEIGSAIITRARVISGEMRRLDDDVRQIQGDLTGTIAVTVSPLAASRIIPPAISRFRRRYPKVVIHLTSGHPPSAIAPLHRGETDFVIGPEPEVLSGLVSKRLLETPIAFMTGMTSRFAETETIRDLADAEWISIGGVDRPPTSDQLFRRFGLPTPQPVTRSDSIISILAMLEESDLVCSFPALLMPELVRRWRVTAIPVKETMPPIRISLLRSQERPPTPAGLVFQDAVLSAVAETFGSLGYNQELYP